MIEPAEQTRRMAAELAEKLFAAGETMNLAGLYSEFSLYSFTKSNYDEVSWVHSIVNSRSVRVEY